MIMSAYALLLKNPKPTRPQIVAGMEDNLCRCAAHHRIVQAIETRGRGRRVVSGRPAPIVTPPTPAAAALSRRRFVRLVGGGIIVLFNADLSDLLGQETRTRGYPTDFNAYLRIAGDGRVTVYSGKIEMGQGVVTSLAQMAADELAVPLDSVDMVMGDTALCPFDNGTYGSMSTRFSARRCGPRRPRRRRSSSRSPPNAWASCRSLSASRTAS